MSSLGRFLKKIIPSEGEFFPLLEELAKNLEVAGKDLQGLRTAESWNEITKVATRIKQIEHESDTVTHQIFELLNRTFITPIDREDIHNLANNLDDTLDLIDAVVARIALYRVESLTADMKEQVRVFGEATAEVRSMVGDLSRLSKSPDFQARNRTIHRLEKEGDMIYRRAMAALFSKCAGPLEVIKQKDILEGLENSIDYCQSLSDIAEQIMFKHS